jgi:hypothetical protein
MGDSDTADLSKDIVDFLKSSSYEVDGPTFGMIFTANGAPRGVKVNLNPDKPTQPIQITVGIR